MKAGSEDRILGRSVVFGILVMFTFSTFTPVFDVKSLVRWLLFGSVASYSAWIYQRSKHDN